MSIRKNRNKNNDSGGMPDLKGQRILITGGLGFIGSNLAHRCVKSGAQVTIYDCRVPHSGANLYNIRDIQDSVEMCYCDILDFDKVSKHIVEKDIIFNCAASTSHHFSMREPWIDMDVNSKGVINLLEAAHRFNPDIKFIHLGTSTQLGMLYYKPADEKHPEFPTDIYSANKSVSEKYVLIYAKAHKIRSTVIRLSNVYGPRASIHSPEFTFNNFFIGLALQGKDVEVFGKGSQLRNMIYVEDAVTALILASQTDKVYGETFFAAGDKHYSVAQIAEEIMQCMGSGKVKFVRWPKDRESVDVGDAVISNQKIKKTLNWTVKYDLKEGLIKTREYYKYCLERYLR